jgi:hypothetical protein
MPLSLEQEKLSSDLQARVRQCRSTSRYYYYAAHVTEFLAVGASVATAIFVAGDWLPKGIVVTIAFVAAASTGLRTVFKFEAFFDWWRDAQHKFDTLGRRLVYEGRHESEVSKDLSDFLVAHEKRRPKFGKLPSSKSHA